MAGISVSGLISGSFDWQSVVDQLIQIDSAPVTTAQNDESANTDKLTSLAALRTDATSFQTAVDALKADGLFTGRTATSTTVGSNWALNAANGAAAGSYQLGVSQLATAGQRVGAGNIGAPLSASSDVSALTLANLRTATGVTAGTFTIDDAQVTIATTDSLKDVFDKIALATGDVTATYHPDTDTISLQRTSGELLLGSATDTSNFLSAMKLTNSGTSTAASTNALGTVTTTATLANSGLTAGASGAGSFTINGVSINYDTSTDTLAALLSRINASGAGVTAAYDSTNDRVTLTNNATGDTGMSVVDSSDGILAALGLTTASGATFAHGKNALFTVNGGAQQSSKSNTLDATALGVSGLTVTANSTDTQTITVAPNTDAMNTAIQGFISSFNTFQTDIDSATKVTTGTDGTVKTSVLSGDSDVESWGSDLRALAFAGISGLTGSVQRLDDLGLDFSATDNTLSVTDQSKLDAALSNSTTDVNNFFTQASTGFVAKFDTYLNNLLNTSTGAIAVQTNTLNKQNTDLAAQIVTLNNRLTDERTQLTNAFLAMQDAQSTASTQQQTIASMFPSSSSSSNSSSSSCWVARAVYGAGNPRWLLFRHWLLHYAPRWFRALYLRHGERFADWLRDKPLLRSTIRRWMDARIAALPAIRSGV